MRETLQNSGVHNIQYTVQVFDARSGEALTQPQNIKAEFPALVGKAGDEADARGLTQRVQIVNQIAAVTQNWLGSGADPRGTFSRLGCSARSRRGRLLPRFARKPRPAWR